MPAYAVDDLQPVVDPTAFVHPDAVLTGDVLIGARSYIGPNASLRADFGPITVAERSNARDCCVLHCFPGEDTVRESGSHIGHGAALHGCHIGEGVLIGMNSVLMDGARVGEGATVGGNTLDPAGFVELGRRVARHDEARCPVGRARTPPPAIHTGTGVWNAAPCVPQPQGDEKVMSPDDLLTLTRQLLAAAQLEVPDDELPAVVAGVAAARATAELLDRTPAVDAAQE